MQGSGPVENASIQIHESWHLLLSLWPLRFYKPINNQAVEPVTSGGDKVPAKMSQAFSTDGHPPEVPREPGKFIGGRSDTPAAGSRFITTNLIYNPNRIGKSMPVAAVHPCPFVRGGNHMPALPAEDVPFSHSLNILRLYIGMGFRWCLRPDCRIFKIDGLNLHFTV